MTSTGFGRAALAAWVAVSMMTAAAPAAMAQAQPAPAAPAAPRDPQALAAAREYVRAAQLAAGLSRGLPQMSENVVRQVRLKNPGAPEEVMKAFSDAFFEEFALKRAAEIETAVAEAVVDSYTRDEIVALRNFYLSPIGRSITQKSATFAGKVPAALQGWAQKAGPEALKAAADRMKAQGRDLRY